MTEKDNSIIECENLIKQVRGVISAKIQAGDDGTILEIHVLAETSRSPKQVVRDIESAVLVQLGIELDHKKISVAQLQGADESVLDLRPFLEGIELVIKGAKVEARATINLGEEIFVGSASGPNIMKNRLRLIAMATLTAIESYLSGTMRFMLEDVQKVSFIGRETILAGVSLATPTGEETLIGCALVMGDDRESAAKAVLDALNRRLFLLKKN